ncbi:hypothetical protein OROHE_021353 [Orobanche hederae]
MANLSKFDTAIDIAKSLVESTTETYEIMKGKIARCEEEVAASNRKLSSEIAASISKLSDDLVLLELAKDSMENTLNFMEEVKEDARSVGELREHEEIEDAGEMMKLCKKRMKDAKLQLKDNKVIAEVQHAVLVINLNEIQQRL